MGLLLFLVLVLLTYLAAIDLFAEPERRPNLAQAVSAATFGMLCLGATLVLIRWVSLPWEILPVLLTTVAAFVAYKRRRCLLPTFGLQWDWGTCMIIVVTTAFMLPVIVGGAMMGAGDYPQVFFNSDTPYRLTHVHQFIEDRGMPPLSLSMLGMRFGYHYAAPAAASATALLTGLTAHASYALTLGMGALGIVAVAYLVAASMAPQVPLALRFSLMLGAAPLTILGASQLPRQWFDDAELFANQFAEISGIFGTFLLILTLFGCLGLAVARRSVLAVASSILVAAVATGFYPVAGLLVASGALARAYETRDLRWLLLPVAVFVAGVAIMQTSGHATTGALVFEPFFLFRQFSYWAIGQSQDILLFLAPPIAYLIITRCAIGLEQQDWHHLIVLLLTLAGLFAFLNLVGHYVISLDGAVRPDFNLLVPLRVLPKLLAAITILGLGVVWISERRMLNQAIGVIASLIFVLPLAHRASHAAVFLFEPQAGHEFVDNRPIAEALKRIPVKGSVIVTNDLRYPAQDFRRHLRQLQIPSLFGHQAYVVNPTFERNRDYRTRLELQNLVAQADWSPEIAQVASNIGWTHLLIHEPAPHPSHIPLPKLFENERYSVYAFE